jgi:hypothetical protein
MTGLTARALGGTDTLIDGPALETFKASLGDRLIVPGSPLYEDARKVFNAMIDRRPALIVRCRGVADVIRSVNFAREHGLLVAIRGGGHSGAGFSTCDGGLVIDLSEMKGIRIDVARRTVRAEGGVTWADLDRETQVFGLAAPGGVVSNTGIAGLTLGGGQGWLRRTSAMSCDNLLSADVVTARGELLNVSSTNQPDLFWALKGGGGNFGVVTSFEYQLHQVGPVVALALPVYAAENGASILNRFRQFVSNAADDVNAAAVFWTLPASPAFPRQFHGRDVIIIAAMYAGAADAGEAALRPLRELDEPLFDMSSSIPYTVAQQLFDPFFVKGELSHYWRSLYLDSLGDEVIRQIVASAARRPSRRSMIDVWALGGALARVDADATPLGRRAAPFLLQVVGSWEKPEETDPNIAWVRNGFQAMLPFSSGKPNLNLTDVGDEAETMVHAAFGPHYERLVAVKTRYDPSNLFRLNPNITPTAT